MKILLTGFEPFGGETINPAKEAVKLVKKEIKGAQIVKCYVPVVFGKAIETVHEAMKKENPDVVLCIGQAGGRYEITPERVAINCDDGRIPDNEGNQPVDQPVFADGAPAYFSTLPIKKMVGYMKAANIPAAISNTAGTYVCNHLMYGVCYYIEKNSRTRSADSCTYRSYMNRSSTKKRLRLFPKRMSSKVLKLPSKPSSIH